MKAEDGEETFKVDEKGYAEFRYLPVGKYSLVETVPIGYITDGTTEFELTTELLSSRLFGVVSTWMRSAFLSERIDRMLTHSYR